jgi:ribosomal protein S18 acetylase RimI-like enzyme
VVFLRDASGAANLYLRPGYHESCTCGNLWEGADAVMSIVDLRQTTSRQLAALLDEETQRWREELHWDYRGSLDLIKKFVDARSLAGGLAMQNGQPAGYSFYVLEDHKALLGGLFVSSRWPQPRIAEELLDYTLQILRQLPRLERIEAQLIPFGFDLVQTLTRQGFRLYPRHFMLLNLRPSPGADSGEPAPSRQAAVSGLRLERWEDRYFAPCARLIQLAYADHTDGEINDQYRSESGALKFLKNIVLLPGCGQFQPQASFVLRPPHSNELAGVILTSLVAPRVAHITQICVMPGYQRNGIGRRLMQSAMDSLCTRGVQELSLTVTAANERAVRLYQNIGFKTIKTFTAGVWLADGLN